MSNRILSHIVDASTKHILRIRHETKVIVHTNMLAVRQKLWILQGGQRGRAVRGISSWKSVESVVDLARRSILDLDPKAYRNENSLIFLTAAVPYFSLETFPANSAHFVSRGIEFEECLFVQAKTSAEGVYLRYKVSFLVHFCHR